jgi:colicin import membrane protein
MTGFSMSSIAAKFTAAAAALLIASCGIEAAEQTTAKSPAEQIAERFSEPQAASEKLAEAQAQVETARKSAEAARKSSDEARRVAAAKRAAEKGRKEAADAAAARATEQVRADEADMLARARAEAEERRAEMEAARIEREQAEVAAAAAERVRAEAEAVAAAKAAQAQKQAEEARRLAEEALIAEAKARAAERERTEEIQRQAELKQQEARREAAARALAESKAQLAEQERAAEAQRQAELKALEARREAEAKLLAEKLRAAEAAREAKATELARKDAALSAPQADQASAADSVVSLARPGSMPARATILIVMEPGTKGIRRFNKSADPILCVRDGCYISEGAAQPAQLASRGRALGIGNTWGRRAGACQHSLGCTFRGVDLAGSGGFVQPVDMKVMVHDRRESQIITADSDCRLENGRIACRRPVTSNGYRMWIVPEELAERAGGGVLEAAVRSGLQASQSADLLR